MPGVGENEFDLLFEVRSYYIARYGWSVLWFHFIIVFFARSRPQSDPSLSLSLSRRRSPVVRSPPRSSSRPFATSSCRSPPRATRPTGWWCVSTLASLESNTQITASPPFCFQLFFLTPPSHEPNRQRCSYRPSSSASRITSRTRRYPSLTRYAPPPPPMHTRSCSFSLACDAQNCAPHLGVRVHVRSVDFYEHPPIERRSDHTMITTCVSRCNSSFLSSPSSPPAD